MFETRMETTCGCIVGGAGLAGMGFLFNALKSGALADLAEKGLIVIDVSGQPGTGMLGHYRITANSVGDVFIDCLRDPALRDVFRLQVESLDGTRRVCCKSLVLNLGGRQDPQQLITSLARQGLMLSGTTTIQSADRLLRMNVVQLREVFASVLASNKRITLVGGSHSAFSMLENLADALEFAGLQELTLVHRSRIRLFYENVQQAHAAGYQVDALQDVCPISGRVNRSGGLRYRALDIGREAALTGRVGKTGVRVKMFQTLDGPIGDHEQARLALADSGVVVQCSGYQAVLPTLRDADGSLVRLRESKGGLDSDASGCPLDQHGRRLSGLYLFGLGAGLGVDPQLGSEPAFDGRIYGVWQFHHDASRAVLGAVINRLAHKASVVEALCADVFAPQALRLQAG
ncbi:hypothetical protein CFBP6411_02122 [Pseudomonas syringae group genomosp. 3]|uniref:Pyridine nucleotide-disulfide oxidoreductase n=1 Tax=Pseudomonas syringae group genomosp. 3 TaxID=251701 RepID=A0A2K4WC71_9PSED|nr:pyridine nucleotide-disulfide oxidoreductase [Pseudomonas syringae group genomosp. 3]SOS33482.1 hypothetical protein CFBP6411_02122 [Pseudomonas syringae group genomosp. 3]